MAFRGWGRGLREAVAGWYNDKEIGRLAYQVVKYRQRGGWTHRDALRLAHPKPPDKAHKHLYGWITQGETKKQTPDLVNAFVTMQAAETEKQVIELITSHNLPWETIPTQFLKSPTVWEALLPKLPLTATIRNLGRMTAIGLLKPMSEAALTVASKLTDTVALGKARVHPLSVLVALKTYEQGKGLRGSLTWQPVAQIVDVLDEVFYLAFGSVEPMGKNIMLAVDASGSMTAGIAGMPLSCREAAVAMALTTAKTEQSYMVLGFTCRNHYMELPITPRNRLDDAMRSLERHIKGQGTDCGLPMQYALENRIPVDTFILYTDSETWAGLEGHPVQRLQEYRDKMSIPAKMVICAMASNGFSVADPNDGGMLDVVGFSTSTPQVISDFAKN